MDLNFCQFTTFQWEEQLKKRIINSLNGLREEATPCFLLAWRSSSSILWADGKLRVVIRPTLLTLRWPNGFSLHFYICIEEAIFDLSLWFFFCYHQLLLTVFGVLFWHVKAPHLTFYMHTKAAKEKNTKHFSLFILQVRRLFVFKFRFVEEAFETLGVLFWFKNELFWCFYAL